MQLKPYHTGLVNNGVWDVYNGDVRIKDKEGKIYAEFGSENYLDYMAEKVKPYSWLKFPYVKDLGYPEGIYRVAPLSRLNVADKMPSPHSPGHTSKNSKTPLDMHNNHYSSTGQG